MKPEDRPKFRFGFYWPFEPQEKTYSLIVLFSVTTIFMSRFLTDGPPVALAFLVSAALGFFFKWRKMPMFGVVLLAYFLFAPLLVPLGPSSNMIFRVAHLEPMTLILTVAVLVYLASQYRLYGVMQRAMPDDSVRSSKQVVDPNLRRIDVVTTNELIRMFVMLTVCVFAGETIYLLVTEIYVEPSQPNLPIRLAGAINMEISGLPGSVQPWVSRLILTIGGMVIIVMMARMGFWYWRLANLTREEGAAIVADTAWAENHSNFRRNWLWRAWAVNRNRPPKGRES